MLIKSTLAVVALVATMVSGCEPPCRRGVAQAFADSYAPVVQDAVSQLHSTLKTNLFQSITVPVQITSVVPEDSIKDAVLRAVQETLEIYTNRATGKPLTTGIYNVMFNEQDPFKGDCNHPKRLNRTMPPEGVSWTLDECDHMDYICGNPPSICYHLQMVKTRIIGRIKNQLTDNATFDDGLLVHSLVLNIKRAVHSVMTHYGAGSMTDNVHVMEYANSLVSNAIKTLGEWVNTDVQSLCDGSASESSHCSGWDPQIKLEILKWP
ncbi:uncharacterized protein BX664DRAFT_333833 [Halteromyces radiatus]|uniref:uncharacterized protein n=1 Tax=Halteromyces radiatus TaxID=101107 RepID=UPI00221EA675|nr:uncharacterized protein BX664DRAFT_333833 [Halteromyces radiatus]KAI8089764.1 hypothetical protein BX664DRAFT_333833 [Halteromyces radiatus]